MKMVGAARFELAKPKAPGLQPGRFVHFRKHPKHNKNSSGGCGRIRTYEAAWRLVYSQMGLFTPQRIRLRWPARRVRNAQRRAVAEGNGQYRALARNGSMMV